MRKGSRGLVGSLVGFLALSASAPQDDAQALRETLRELRTLRANSYRLMRERQTRIDAARDTAAALRADLKEAEEELRQADGQLAAIRKDTDDLEAPLKRAAASRRENSAALDAFFKAAQLHVAEGLPYRSESRTKHAAGGVETDGPLAETAGRARTLFQDELRISRSGEAYSDEVKLPDGRRKHARILRIGLHLLAFVTEDGKDVGLRVKGEGWVTDPSRFDSDAVRAAIEILDRTRAPDWVTLPVPLTGKAEK